MDWAGLREEEKTLKAADGWQKMKLEEMGETQKETEKA